MSGTAFAGCFGPPPPPPANQAPFAVATQSSNLVFASEAVTFSATGQDTDGTISTWSWDFGDGTNATGQNTTHAFAHQGTYYVTLNVTDNGGLTYDTVRTGVPLRVNVLPKFAATTSPNQPLADLSLWSASTVIKPGNAVSWSARSSYPSWNADEALPGKLMGYSMTFGDGSSSSQTQAALDAKTWDGNFSHTYTAAGKFPSTLTVTSSAQNRYTVEFVDNGDAANATSGEYDNISIETGDWDGLVDHTFANGTDNETDDFDAEFNLTMNGAVTTYTIYFGDGTNVSHDDAALAAGTWDGKFSHTYATGGILSGSLTVARLPAKTDMAVWTVVVIGAAPTPGVKNSDTLIIETIGQPDVLDPAIAYDDASGQIIQAVYETLITYDGANADQFVPLIATEIPTVGNGGISTDGTIYTFHIKHGINFTGGDTLDADDVVYSLSRVIKINDPASAAWILTQVFQTLDTKGTADPSDDEMVFDQTRIQATDPYTVKMTLVQPYGAFLSTLAYTVAAIVSKSTVEAHGGVVAGERNEWMLRNMEGTGPFVLNSWVSGQQIVLDKNMKYWNATGAAKLNHIVIAYKTEFSTRLIELRNGDADIIYVPGTNRPEMQRIADDPAEKIRIESGASTWVITTGAFNFNINTTNRASAIGAVNYPDNVPSDFFMDAKMRKAFAQAFNYSDYITNVAKGLALPLNGVIPRGMYGYDPALQAAQYDLNAAKAIYATTRWATDAAYNPGGAAGGFNMTVGYNCGNTNRQQMSLILQRGVEQLGTNIHINVKCFEWAVYLSLTLHTASEGPGPIGVFFIGWGPDYADPDDYVIPFCKSGGTYARYTGFVNTSLDTMMVDAGKIPNSPTRLDLYHQIQASVVNENVYIYVSEAKNFHIAKTWVKGWYFNPMYSGSDLGGNMASVYKE